MKPCSDDLPGDPVLGHWLSVSVDKLSKPIIRKDMVIRAFFTGSSKNALFPLPVLSMDLAVEEGLKELPLPFIEGLTKTKNRFQVV